LIVVDECARYSDWQRRSVLAAAAKDQGHTETTLADKAQIAFDTVRSLAGATIRRQREVA